MEIKSNPIDGKGINCRGMESKTRAMVWSKTFERGRMGVVSLDDNKGLPNCGRSQPDGSKRNLDELNH